MLFLITTIPAMGMLGTCIGLYGDPKDIALAVVNHDVEGTSYDTGCFKNDTLKDSCRVEQLSCTFLESLGNTIKLVKQIV